MNFEDKIKSIRAKVKLVSEWNKELAEKYEGLMKEYEMYKNYCSHLMREFENLEREAKGKNLEEIRTLRREIKKIEPYGSEEVAMAYA